MAGKLLNNQRKILIILSSRLEKANWDLEITLKEFNKLINVIYILGKNEYIEICE